MAFAIHWFHFGMQNNFRNYVVRMWSSREEPSAVFYFLRPWITMNLIWSETWFGPWATFFRVMIFSGLSGRWMSWIHLSEIMKRLCNRRGPRSKDLKDWAKWAIQVTKQPRHETMSNFQSSRSPVRLSKSKSNQNCIGASHDSVTFSKNQIEIWIYQN